MDTGFEALHARVLYLEGMVAALMALHPQAEQLQHFVPEIVGVVKTERDEAVSADNAQKAEKLNAWLDSFSAAQEDINSEFSYCRKAFRLPPTS